VAKKQPDTTPEQRAKQKVIDSIRALTHYKAYTLGQIETTLGLPQNSLSGMLSGSRNMSPKWQRLLEEFIKALPKEDKTITIKIDQGEPELEPHAGEPEVQMVEVPIPAPKKAVVKKDMPPGLTKAQQIRWHRENSQTLL
jgi:hypothetical protein